MLLLTSSHLWADCNAPETFSGASGVNSEWRHGGMLIDTCNGTFSINDLASAAAPVLWFSPDEPLIRAHVSVPQSIPTDAEGAVVYYNVQSVRLVKGSTEDGPCKNDF
jgi:hypothetical protein